ncbi:FtsX-like permease family protein [Ruegeria pomeroyi]|uniref:ABC transporter, permease protein n=2 Tax=Ruegeria pomeroyi TaxID=89184 RepID=Q5LWA9_RUEPO|nr:FtsX-like permease family protein [Ruegeria pomeroyi]AAV93751.1 ABC transporter, permease protein [Ruegeria pomeroyi DSS-3]NVK98607.1 FtsX-like permease family protein [Ruegeria pomeroyi]NVL03700.1 FtsX-like permease family protein [Ruegeria pomeroyi]QWV07342.1 FtsX-like permease family protein [Ruegeria pomeroyi]
MSLRLAARLARRELRGGLRGFRIFLACLALGVAAIAAVGSVRSAIEAGLSREGAALLGGDAQMGFTYRFATPEERDWMQARASRVSELVDFRSMAVVGAERALTQVKAVDGAYPLLGSVTLDPDLPLDQALAGAKGLPGGVMEPVLSDRLGLQPGDRFRLGTQEFVLMARLMQVPDGVADGFALGPRTLVRTADLAQSGLLAPGTLFDTKYRLDLPPDSDLASIAQDARGRFTDSGLRWTDARNGAPGIADFTRRLGAFLILVGLSGLAVGGIGVSAAVRAYLADKTTTIATLRTLGADRRIVFQTYFLQIGALSGLGILLGLVLGGLAPLLLAPLIEAQLPVPAVFAIYPEPLAEAAIYGLLTALVFTLWPLARTEEVRAATLLRDALSRAPLLPRLRYVLATGAGLALLCGLAAWFSGALALTLWTLGGIAGALLLLAIAASAVQALSRAAAPLARGRPALRWALASISSPRQGAAPVMLSLGLGLSVLAAVGQIDGTLRNAISGNLPDVAPSYFFVDIQRDQMPGFTARLESDPGVSRVESAPMLRGIITRINDRPAREVAGNHWVVRGDRGVTYSAELPDTTRLTEGAWWPQDYDGPPLISFAAEEGAEMGLQLGDTLTVNILGRDITARIASFREVDFSTAGMGFVMAMNPAALSGAPHSNIATVYAEPDAEAAILRDLASAYPNITAIRVRDAIDRAAGLLAGLASATSYGAGVSLLTGFLVLIGAAAAGQGARIYEAAVLRTLGASRRRILLSLALRSALLGAAAGTIALAAGILGGWAVSRFVFETSFTVIWPSAILIVLGGVLAVLGASLVFALPPLAARPARVLRARE